jgi:hypothetical protein
MPTAKTPKAPKPVPLTKDVIRKHALEMLRARQCKVWRNNNLAVRGRKFIGELGVPDIIGYQRNTAIWLGCEIKTLNDRLSADQIKFLTELKAAGGLALLALQEGNNVVLKEWLND